MFAVSLHKFTPISSLVSRGLQELRLCLVVGPTVAPCAEDAAYCSVAVSLHKFTPISSLVSRGLQELRLCLVVGPTVAPCAEDAAYCSVAWQAFGGLRYLLVLVGIVCFVDGFSSSLRLLLKRVRPNHGGAIADGDVYPHIFACPSMTAVLLFDQTDPHRLENAVGRNPVHRSVFGRNWSQSPQEFVRLLEMASWRRTISRMRAVPGAVEVAERRRRDELGLEQSLPNEWNAVEGKLPSPAAGKWRVLGSSDGAGCGVLGSLDVEKAILGCWTWAGDERLSPSMRHDRGMCARRKRLAQTRRTKWLWIMYSVHGCCKRTSCAEDQVVIEMLRELDSDVWETIASCFQFRLMNHWTEDVDNLWNQQLVTVVKKKNSRLTMRGFGPIAMLPTIYRPYSKTLQQLAEQALRSRRGPQYGHVHGPQAHEVVFMLEWVGGTGYGVANAGEALWC